MFLVILGIVGAILVAKKIEFCLVSNKILNLLTQYGEMTFDDFNKQIKCFNLSKILYTMEIRLQLATQKKEVCNAVLCRDALDLLH